MMSEKKMPARNAIALHLSAGGQAGQFRIYSGFFKALTEARAITGRDPNTGRKLPGKRRDAWIGACAYIILLDQIGSCFRPTAVNVVASTTIHRALKYFSSLSDAEIDAIYALRNAFLHDFSLYNQNPKKPALTHHFQLESKQGAPAVTLPSTPWSGDPARRTSKNVTVIGLPAIGDLVEGICLELFKLANASQLSVELAGGSDELLARYSVLQR